jgi:hypothetical protein
MQFEALSCRNARKLFSSYSDPPPVRLNTVAQRLARPPRVRLVCLHKLKMLSEVLLSSANRDLIEVTWRFVIESVPSQAAEKVVVANRRLPSAAKAGSIFKELRTG